MTHGFAFSLFLGCVGFLACGAYLIYRSLRQLGISPARAFGGVVRRFVGALSLVGGLFAFAVLAQTTVGPIGGYNFFGGGNMWGQTGTFYGGQSDAGAAGNCDVTAAAGLAICLDGTVVGNAPTAGMKYVAAQQAIQSTVAINAPAFTGALQFAPDAGSPTVQNLWTQVGIVTTSSKQFTVTYPKAFNSDAGIPVFCDFQIYGEDGGFGCAVDGNAQVATATQPGYTSVTGNCTGANAADPLGWMCVGPL